MKTLVMAVYALSFVPTFASAAEKPIKVRRGSFAGNGADFLQIEAGAAFFIGDRANVRVCIDGAKIDAAALTALKRAFGEAHDRWFAYLEAKGALAKLEKKGRRLVRGWAEDCNDPDLRLRFEDQTTDVVIDRPQGAQAGARIDLPMAMLDRPESRLQTLVQIWASLCGTGPIEGTFLDPALAAEFPRRARRELVSSESAPLVASRVRTRLARAQASALFKRFAGRALEGDLHATFSLRSRVEGARGVVALIDRGAKGPIASTFVDLRLGTLIGSERVSDGKVLRTVVDGEASEMPVHAWSWNATLTSADGKTFDAVLVLNQQTALELRLVEGDAWTPVVQSEWIDDGP